MLTEEVMGRSVDDVRSLTRVDIIDMIGIPLGPVRLKCAMLSLKTINKGLDKC